MGRVLQESTVSTRNARAGLPVGLYWRGIDAEVHLGYRRGKRGGSWLVRWRVGKGYRQAPIGAADDSLAEGTLSFEAAVRAARSLVEGARAEARLAATGPMPTVQDAVFSYIAERDARDSRRAGRVVRSDASRRMELHVLGRPAVGRRKAVAATPLAAVELHRLTEVVLRAWREGLPPTLKATTQQRLVNDLKAALNAACAVHRDRIGPTIPMIVKAGLQATKIDDEAAPVARDNQILSDSDIARLLRAAREIDTEQDWSGDLFRIVLVLAATGARFSQIARLRVVDCQVAERRLMVPVSRKGNGKAGSITVPVGQDVIDTLVPILSGRAPDAFLLERWRNVQVKGSIAWKRDRRGPWQSAAELVRPWQSIRDRAGKPDVIPYALRHSSIVRGIRQNLPIRLVAATHDSSVAMLERHYSRWITSGLEEMVRAAIVPMVPVGEARDVIPFRGGRK
ncbi:MAG: tyrosine-type recombinase/integrase [Nitratireductor sp.]